MHKVTMMVQKRDISKSKLKILILGLFLLIMFSVLYLKNWVVSDIVQIKCRYMAYACGDCYPKYKVTVPPKSQPQLADEDIDIKFTSVTQEKKMDQIVANCAICYEYVFTGIVRKNILTGNYSFNTNDFQLIEKTGCCSEK